VKRDLAPRNIAGDNAVNAGIRFSNRAARAGTNARFTNMTSDDVIHLRIENKNIRKVVFQKVFKVKLRFSLICVATPAAALLCTGPPYGVWQFCYKTEDDAIFYKVLD